MKHLKHAAQAAPANRDSLKVGHHMVVAPIQTRYPFDGNEIPAGARLDLIELGETHALVRYQGMRCWKSITDIQNRVCLLVPWVTDEEGLKFVTPVHPVDADLLPIEGEFRRLAS
jgi:hypothetical protein